MCQAQWDTPIAYMVPFAGLLFLMDRFQPSSMVVDQETIVVAAGRDSRGCEIRTDSFW